MVNECCSVDTAVSCMAENDINALQEHFSLPYENEQPIPLTIPKEEDSGLEQELQGSGLFDEYGSGLGLMAGNGSSNEAQEAAFDRELRRKKKKRKGRNL